MPRDPRALRPVNNRPTAHGAHALWRTWRGCLRGQRLTRSTSCRWPKLFRADTASGRRLQFRNFVTAAFGSRGARPARASTRKNRPRAHGARTSSQDLAWFLRSQRGAHSTPRRWPRLFFTNTAPGRRLRLRNVVATAFGSRGARPTCASPREEPADGPRSTRSLSDFALLSSRPTAQRAPSLTVGRGLAAPTPPQVGGCSFETSRPPRSAPVARGPRALRPVENRPRAHGVRTSSQDLAWLLRSQRGARSTPRRWPRLFFINTAPGWRLRLRNVVATAFGSRGARPTCASPREEPAAGPRSTRSLSDFALIIVFAANGAMRSTPHRWPGLSCTDTASGRRLWLRNIMATASGSRGARPARASLRGEQAEGPRSTRSLSEFAW